ncbi:hypothetical protein BCR35DRAFT_333876 [Leucosporidium creatinivorum]|uniref:Uncharacterized protein n=1 Tax=Leucosporidium creatinivorum TaxID=106004 RepID=A0A1Y2EMZ3_9BASI|nr:hypothetical protein BCR35DRAFT_333876 [Leucosporidium creatinivorum]
MSTRPPNAKPALVSEPSIRLGNLPKCDFCASTLSRHHQTPLMQQAFTVHTRSRLLSRRRNMPFAPSPLFLQHQAEARDPRIRAENLRDEHWRASRRVEQSQADLALLKEKKGNIRSKLRRNSWEQGRLQNEMKRMGLEPAPRRRREDFNSETASSQEPPYLHTPPQPSTFSTHPRNGRPSPPAEGPILPVSPRSHVHHHPPPPQQASPLPPHEQPYNPRDPSTWFNGERPHELQRPAHQFELRDKDVWAQPGFRAPPAGQHHLLEEEDKRRKFERALEEQKRRETDELNPRKKWHHDLHKRAYRRAFHAVSRENLRSTVKKANVFKRRVHADEILRPKK